MNAPGWPDDLAAVLHSAGPHPGQAEQLDLFGRFLGMWDVDWHGTDRHGRPATMAGPARPVTPPPGPAGDTDEHA